MKTIQNIPGIVLCMVIASMPCYLQAQVIRISGGAHMIVSGDAKIVLQGENPGNRGSIITGRNTATFTGFSEMPVLASKNIPITLDNILVRKSFGQSQPGNDISVNIFLGKELSFSKPQAIQTFLQAYPNPTTERFTLTISSDKELADMIMLQDGSGRILERRRVNYRAGLNTIHWDMSKYAVGTYLLVFENGPQRYLKVVKQ